MASANLDLVPSIYGEWERGDFSSAEWAAPEVEFVSASGPAPGSWTGRAEMATVWGEFLANWKDYRGEADEYRQLDAERVLVLLHVGGRGKTSDLRVEEIQARGATLFHIHDGKVTRLVVYLDREQALADLGIEE